MKIIFSRKGFDSAAGGFPSPIFPDGTLFSIPIPSRFDKLSYGDLQGEWDGTPISLILNDLSGGKIYRQKSWHVCDYSSDEQRCHHDPMWISKEPMPKLALGQAGRADGHLRKQNISIGDIFLFYGWFRQVDFIDGRWSYCPTAKDVHVIWSYMTIGDVLRIDTPSQKADAVSAYHFLKQHPHLDRRQDSNNSIYISKEARALSFGDYNCLTDMKVYEGRAKWRMPRCMNQPNAFSYLKDFVLDKDDVIIRYRGYGQEFVLDLELVNNAQDVTDIEQFISGVIS